MKGENFANSLGGGHSLGGTEHAKFQKQTDQNAGSVGLLVFKQHVSSSR